MRLLAKSPLVSRAAQALLAPILIACIALAPDSAAAFVNDRVERVVDGDTVVLRDIGKARLIGIDTPETVSIAQRQFMDPTHNAATTGSGCN
jgi:endonuclease YncB( thermonuclease family)